MTENRLDINIEEITKCKIPKSILENFKNKKLLVALNKKEIEKIVAFHSPFLRTEKILIFGDEFNGSSSIGIGTIYPEDMEGHYNKTVYLAFAGRLMPSTATIHLAYYFPKTSPQAVEGESIKMDKDAYNGGLIQPKIEGSKFFVETTVIKKKLNLILVNTSIMFGDAKFGLIDNLKFLLTDKNSIYQAKTIPDVI